MEWIVEVRKVKNICTRVKENPRITIISNSDTIINNSETIINSMNTIINNMNTTISKKTTIINNTDTLMKIISWTINNINNLEASMNFHRISTLYIKEVQPIYIFS